MSIVSDYIRRVIRRKLIPDSRYAKFPTPLGPLVMPTDWQRSSQVHNLYVRNRLYEPATVAYLRQNVRPTDSILDVGANFGYYTMLFSGLAPYGWVEAFEPVPECYRVLRENVYSRSNVAIHCTAISDKAEDVWFYRHRNYGMGGLTPREGMDGRFRTVTAALDDYDFRRVDWVKIDVEGHEGEVLEGMRETIERNPQIRLIIEFKPERGLAGCFWDVLSGFKFLNLDHNVLAFREEG